jgi:C4-dicarboxylate-binding protein DctP
VQLGEIHLTLQPAAVVSQIADDVKVLDLPYLMPVDNEKQIYEVLDGELGEELLSRIDGTGINGLGIWYGGYKLFTTNGPEIHSPADFQGLSMRVLPSSVLTAQYENWGAEAVPASYSELYSVLEEGIAHGQENPVQTIALNRYQDVQSQMVQGYHGVMHYVLLTNTAWFESLPENMKEAIIEAEEYGRKEARKAYAAQEADYIATLESAEGVHYYELTPEEIEVFKASVQPVYESQTAGSQWQMDYVKRLQEAFAE